MLRISIHLPVFGIFRATVKQGVSQSYKPYTLNLNSSRSRCGRVKSLAFHQSCHSSTVSELQVYVTWWSQELGDLGFCGCGRGRFVGFLRGRVWGFKCRSNGHGCRTPSRLNPKPDQPACLGLPEPR